MSFYAVCPSMPGTKLQTQLSKWLSKASESGTLTKDCEINAIIGPYVPQLKIQDRYSLNKFEFPNPGSNSAIPNQIHLIISPIPPIIPSPVYPICNYFHQF